jgi:MATE family multidrug resistance protein
MAVNPSPCPWWADFLRLALANVVANLMVPLAGLVDTAFLGHLAEIHHLGGVALATVVFNVIYWGFGFLRMGTTGITAQALGQSEEDEVVRVLLRHGLIALGLGLLVLVLQVPLRQLGFTLLGAQADLRAAGYAFYNARIWDAPAVLLNLVIIGWCLGRGQGGWVIGLSFLGNASNVMFNYLFIWRWGWAAAGAGLGTALSQYVTLLGGLVLVGQSIDLATLQRLLPQLWDGPTLRRLGQLNGDILLRTAAIILSFALFTRASASLGLALLAANTLLLQVVTLSAYFIDGLAFATESFAGRYYGRGDVSLLRRVLWLGGGISVTLGLGFALAFWGFSQPLFSLLTSHGEVVGTVTRYVGWLVPVLGLGAIAFLLDGFFLGLTASTLLRNSTVVASLVGFLPLALVGQRLANPHLLWFALVGLMAGRALLLARAVPRWFQPGPEHPPAP